MASRATTPEDPAMAMAAQMAVAMSHFDRRALAGFVEVAIGILDVVDGDPDIENYDVDLEEDDHSGTEIDHGEADEGESAPAPDYGIDQTKLPPPYHPERYGSFYETPRRRWPQAR